MSYLWAGRFYLGRFSPFLAFFGGALFSRQAWEGARGTGGRVWEKEEIDIRRRKKERQLQNFQSILSVPSPEGKLVTDSNKIDNVTDSE
jgi:hypothetical protein